MYIYWVYPGPWESRYVLRNGLPLYSYSIDGIETINPTLGRGGDSYRDISCIKFMWTFTENRNTPNIQCMVYLPSKMDILKGKIKCRYPSSARTSRGRKFQRKKTISQRKNLPIECAQGDRPARCPNHFFSVPWWWCDLFWCHEVACGVRWSNVLGCEVTWGELLWLIATWHVMSCHLMRCDCLCCVMSRDAMRCHVMCAHVKSCHLLCPAMGWNVRRLNRHYSLNNYSVLQSTTPVLLQHYSVLQSTTKYRSSTTPYYKVLPQYYKVLLQYYSVLLQYYKVLLQYYSVLQSTTPVLLCTTKCYSSTTLY